MNPTSEIISQNLHTNLMFAWSELTSAHFSGNQLGFATSTLISQFWPTFNDFSYITSGTTLTWRWSFDDPTHERHMNSDWGMVLFRESIIVMVFQCTNLIVFAGSCPGNWSFTLPRSSYKLMRTKKWDIISILVSNRETSSEAKSNRSKSHFYQIEHPNRKSNEKLKTKKRKFRFKSRHWHFLEI